MPSIWKDPTWLNNFGAALSTQGGANGGGFNLGLAMAQARQLTEEERERMRRVQAEEDERAARDKERAFYRQLQEAQEGRASRSEERVIAEALGLKTRNEEREVEIDAAINSRNPETLAALDPGKLLQFLQEKQEEEQREEQEETYRRLLSEQGPEAALTEGDPLGMAALQLRGGAPDIQGERMSQAFQMLKLEEAYNKANGGEFGDRPAVPFNDWAASQGLVEAAPGAGAGSAAGVPPQVAALMAVKQAVERVPGLEQFIDSNEQAQAALQGMVEAGVEPEEVVSALIELQRRDPGAGGQMSPLDMILSNLSDKGAAAMEPWPNILENVIPKGLIP